MRVAAQCNPSTNSRANACPRKLIVDSIRRSVLKVTAFYLHEASEATMMGRGIAYPVAHEAALAKYGVSPFALYAREVVAASPHFSTSPGWVAFWGL
jgi:hypothetical protein